MSFLSGLDDAINQIILPVSEAISAFVFFPIPVGGDQSMPIILIWLVAISLFCTVYFGFINFRLFGHAIQLVRGKDDKAVGEGEITRFQALTTTMSATIGLGNIAGVAVAVSVGGPGAVFWMVLMGFFGMSTKFLEASLGVKYRDTLPGGHYSGGAPYYLSKGLAEKGFPRMGKIFAVFFAICCIGGTLGAGNMFQANQTFRQLVNISGGSELSFWADKGWLFGVLLALLVGAVILGGIRSIAAVASKIVPFMGLLYVLAGLVVIGVHYDRILPALGDIFTYAFSPDAAFGGMLGALIQGVRRAVFSNEAGTGSAGIAHAVARTDQPVSQGIVAMIGPFVDTVVICLITALVIVITGVYNTTGEMEGVALTSRAFETALPWFPYVLALTVFLFAFSTMISWSYYGLKAATYLLGERKSVDLWFKILFCLCIIPGASADLRVVLDLSDAVFFLMAIPNVIGLYMLAPDIKRDLKKYLQTIGKA